MQDMVDTRSQGCSTGPEDQQPAVDGRVAEGHAQRHYCGNRPSCRPKLNSWHPLNHAMESACIADNIARHLAGCQAGMVGNSRKHRAYLQQTYINEQLRNMQMQPMVAAQQDLDKAFCSVWLDSQTILVGTKCNSLVAVQPHTGRHTVLQYPQQPPHRLGPDLLAAPAGIISCGQHALAVSPGRQWLVSGGQSPQDILLWQVLQEDCYYYACDGSDSSGRCDGDADGVQQGGQGGGVAEGGLTRQRSSYTVASSRTVLQPVQTCMGHADWVFDMTWLSDTVFMSAGRDHTVKLWQLPKEAAAAATVNNRLQYDNRPAACSTSVIYHKDKVRCVQYDQQQQLAVSLCVDGTLGFWTPELQLCGSCLVPHDTEGPQALLVHGNLIAVGSLSDTLLLDARVAHKVVGKIQASDVAGAGSGDGSNGSTKRQRTAQEQQLIQQSSASLLQQSPQLQYSTEQRWQQNEDQFGEQQQSDSDSAHDEDSEGPLLDDSDEEHRQGQQQIQQQQQQPLLELDQECLLRELTMALWRRDVDRQQQIRPLLPAEVFYAMQRGVEAQQRHLAHARQADAAPFWERHGQKRLRCADHGAAAAAGVEAEAIGAVAAGDNGVRSLSLHHNLLGIGTGDGKLLFHDMRRLSNATDAFAAARSTASQSCTSTLQQGSRSSSTTALYNTSSTLAAYDQDWVSGSWGMLPPRVGCLGLPELPNCRFSETLGSFGFVDYASADMAVYTHCWDPTGTQLFMAGGPLLLGYKGCALAVYS